MMSCVGCAITGPRRRHDTILAVQYSVQHNSVAFTGEREQRIRTAVAVLQAYTLVQKAIPGFNFAIRISYTECTPILTGFAAS